MLGRIMMGMLCVMMLVSTAAADTRLSTAAMKGDKATVQELLKQNVDVNEPQGDGSTALHWAAYRDDLEMATLLVRAGADVEAKTRLADITPLFMASKNGNAAMIELLLTADAKSATTTGTTPLMLAAGSGSVDAVKVLLDNGADVDGKDINQGQTALMFAAALGRAEVIKVLAAHGADLKAVSLVPDPHQPRENNVPLGGLTALHFATREGQMLAVQELVAAGADVNQIAASDEATVLTTAILNGQFDIAKFLLDHGADPKPASRSGVTALYATIEAQWPPRVWYPPPNVNEERTSYLDLMKGLLARGADPNARMGPKLWHRKFHGDWVDPAGATAFWRAAQANDVAAMKLLVEAGADPNIPTLGGCSPLQVAAGFGLEPQVSTFVPDARMVAVKYLVEEVGADVNSKDQNGYTPLHGAALTADNDLILYLVANGADVKARANMVTGRSTDENRQVPPGTGDTVADFANGPRERNIVYPRTVALLEKLGSENSGNCRTAQCVQQTRPRPD
jgi:ankyrin repeat protein